LELFIRFITIMHYIIEVPVNNVFSDNVLHNCD